MERKAAHLERMAIYRLLSTIPFLGASYAHKFALAALLGPLVPLTVFILYLLVSASDFEKMLPVVAALLLACFTGYLGTLWLLRELLVPIELTAEALREYIDTRKLPELPVDFRDHAGRLMEGTQYTLTQLHETIHRLEHVSDSDELTGLYNRRAGEKRLAEETSRAERDLQTFHLAFFDINKFKTINDTFGHSAGDACIAHVGLLLEANTRGGDWVARWGGDEFVVGLHRNRAVKMVIERILHAIESTPCQVAPGREIGVGVSCGVAEYRFGSGPAGVLADADKAMYEAKQVARAEGGSRIAYSEERAGAEAAQPI
jgi:diguanylate cyclase (GGDEF)-like protein